MALLDVLLRAAFSPLSAFLIAASIAALPVFVIGFVRERRIAMIDEATPILLRRVASKMRAGKGLEQSLVESIKEGLKGPLGGARRQLGEDESLEDFLRDMAARFRSPALSLAVGVLKTSGEAETPPEEVLEELADDMDEANRIRRERSERAKSVAITSLTIAVVLLPAIMGLTLNFLSLYSEAAASLMLEIRMMVLAIALYAVLFSGVIAGSTRRYLLLAPAAMLAANLIFEASTILEVL